MPVMLLGQVISISMNSNGLEIVQPSIRLRLCRYTVLRDILSFNATS